MSACPNKALGFTSEKIHQGLCCNTGGARKGQWDFHVITDWCTLMIDCYSKPQEFVLLLIFSNITERNSSFCWNVNRTIKLNMELTERGSCLILRCLGTRDSPRLSELLCQMLSPLPKDMLAFVPPTHQCSRALSSLSPSFLLSVLLSLFQPMRRWRKQVQRWGTPVNYAA